MAAYFGFDAYDIEKNSEPFLFISYKSEDCDRVAVYARYLHDNGINVWYDNGLHAGSDWESYLMSVIERKNCRAVLLFLSSKVADSTVIPLETTQARACKKPTVAVHLEPGLDVEQLLSKAIKVYVEQRQSIFVWTAPRETVCAQVLTAARTAMSGVEVQVNSSAEELWKNALMFLRNAERSRSFEDTSRAEVYLREMTERFPADYRGWLGLAMTMCLPEVTDLDETASRLEGASKYYSYVVAAGADAQASGEYTRVKTKMWDDLICLMYKETEEGRSDIVLQRNIEKVRALEKRMGHTDPVVKKDFDELLENMEEVLAISNQINEESCEWFKLKDGTLCLVKYVGTEESYEVPPDMNGRVVSEIGRDAFRGCVYLKRVTLHEGLRRIGAGAFRGCTELEIINIPKSVRRIGRKAFRGCRALLIKGIGGYFSCAARAARKNHVRYIRTR